MQKIAITTSIKPIVRCAIYTRKSTSKGLDSAFNSLDAQRASCEDYIRRQKHNGWQVVENNYEDVAISGATLKRPALQRLIADIRARLIDMIVVYNLDRFSRSTRDALNTVKILSEYGAEIASVTQPIDTNTADGRQKLRERLSWAEYEYDKARERVLNKIDISKRRGIWMGGMVPYGYDLMNKNLVINQQEAEIVQLIFAEFIKTHSLKAVVIKLREKNIRNKVRTNSSGRSKGGNYFNSNAIYNMLKNPIYAGKIQHQDELYDGQHKAIITAEVWQAAKNAISISPRTRAAQTKCKVPAILQGILRCGGCNSSMTPSHTRKKNGKVYRYYVPIAHLKTSSNSCTIRQVSAPEIESVVLSKLHQVFQKPELLVNVWRNTNNGVSSITENTIRESISNINTFWPELWSGEQQRLLRMMLEKVVVQHGEIEMRVMVDNLHLLLADLTKPQTNTEASCTNLSDSIEENGFSEQTIPLRLTARNVEIHSNILSIRIPIQKLNIGKQGKQLLILPAESDSPLKYATDKTMVKALAQAYYWQKLIDSGKSSAKVISRKYNLHASRVSLVLKLNLLAPYIKQAILNGTQPRTMNMQMLKRPFPDIWAEQIKYFGFSVTMY